MLADFVEVDPAYEKATEEFLHEELEYVVVRNWAEAETRHRPDAHGPGWPCDVPGRSAEIARFRTGTGQTRSPSAIKRLRTVHKWTHSRARRPSPPPGELLFGRGSRHSPAPLPSSIPRHFFFCPMASAITATPSAAGRKKGSGPLALKRELRELSREAATKEKALHETRKLLEDVEREIASLTEDLDRLRGVQQLQEKDALALGHESRKLDEEFSRASSRLSVARLELGRLAHERQRAGEQREHNVRLVEEKEAERSVQEQVLEQSRSDFDEMQEEAGKIAEEHSELRADLAGYEERRRSEKASEVRLENQIREIDTRRQNIAAEMERLGVDRAHLLIE